MRQKSIEKLLADKWEKVMRERYTKYQMNILNWHNIEYRMYILNYIEDKRPRCRFVEPIMYFIFIPKEYLYN